MPEESPVEHTFEELIAGNLARVVAARSRSRELILRFRNGAEGQLRQSEPSGLKRGDVILVREDSWLKMPKRVWPEEPVICIVRGIQPDRLIVEQGSAIRTLPYRGTTELHPGYTIEYFESAADAKVLSTSPIRAHDPHSGVDDIASQFEVSPDPALRLEKFGGYKDVVRRASEILQLQLDQTEAIEAIGARPIRGVIFSGPPGTGKTMLAQIIAKASGAKFFVVSGPQVVSKWVGESEALLRSIFDSARKADKAIIFFDEIDSVASRRSEDSHEASNRLVAQLLTLMDGPYEDKGNVVVVAATNRLSEIDPALLRPGRFDWEIKFDLPDIEERYDILVKSAKPITTLGDLPFEYIAQETDGWSGADLGAIWTEAMICALRRGARMVASDDLVEGFERTLQGKKHTVGERRT